MKNETISAFQQMLIDAQKKAESQSISNFKSAKAEPAKKTVPAKAQEPQKQAIVTPAKVLPTNPANKPKTVAAKSPQALQDLMAGKVIDLRDVIRHNESLNPELSTTTYADLVPAKPAEVPPSKKPEAPKSRLQIVDYSEKAFAVFGEGTKEIKNTLAQLGGSYNANLKCGKGWIFSKKRSLDEVGKKLGLFL